MSITGTGTQADPYVVTTYAELVEKAAESGVYIKVGNDINITDEYPDGDMPNLQMNGCNIDGDGKTISNWYNFNTDHYSVSGDGTIKNARISNIYTNYHFCANGYSSSKYIFEDCRISGIIVGDKVFANLYYVNKVMKGCSVKLLLKSGAGFLYVQQAYGRWADIDNCYVKIKSDGGRSNIFGSDYNGIATMGSDSYYEIDAPNFFSGNTFSTTFSNCVFDITANSTFTFNINDSSASPSIINTTKAPNCTPQNKLLGVTAENWLNTEYLASIGFNAG